MKITYIDGTKSALFSADIENSRIEYVIERDIGIDRDTIDAIRMVFASGKYKNAQQILKNVYGEEHTRIYSIRDFQTDARKNGGTEGENRHEGNQRYREGHSSIIQNQRRTQTLTDRDVLSMAADQILSSDAISMDVAVSDSFGILCFSMRNTQVLTSTIVVRQKITIGKETIPRRTILMKW